MYEILNKINHPKDLKKLKPAELEDLAGEVRYACLERVSNVGGHVGSNLGVTELTIALHYVFDFEVDKLVLDVSHQCYPHKILTGRKQGFICADKIKEITGYLSPEESNFDTFQIGHTSTSISLATGLAKARDLSLKKHNVVAVIGDGSLSGGEAFEGLNNAGTLDSNMIIIVNDNQMSIAENQGSLYNNLKELRETEGKSPNNFFKTLGFDYKFVKNGNNISELISAFEEIKNISHPIVLHVCTLKGNGYELATLQKEVWHWRAPFDIETGNFKNMTASFDYAKLTNDYLSKLSETDEDLVVVTAATPAICGFSPALREKLGKRFVDVAIAEEHAVAFVSALAKEGKHAVFGVHSSFIQRTYDQLSQELALNNAPAVILVYKGGISGANATHLGVFDIALTKSIPNLLCLSPSNDKEYLSMLDWAIKQNQRPVIIRIPTENLQAIPSLEVEEKNYSKVSYEIQRLGKNIAILGLGTELKTALQTATFLKENHNIDATVINPLSSNVLDKDFFDNLLKTHSIITTLENGVLEGGFGESVSRYLSSTNAKVFCFGAEREFVSGKSVSSLREKYNLNPEKIAEILAETFLNNR